MLCKSSGSSQSFIRENRSILWFSCFFCRSVTKRTLLSLLFSWRIKVDSLKSQGSPSSVQRGERQYQQSSAWFLMMGWDRVGYDLIPTKRERSEKQPSGFLSQGLQCCSRVLMVIAPTFRLRWQLCAHLINSPHPFPPLPPHVHLVTVQLNSAHFQFSLAVHRQSTTSGLVPAATLNFMREHTERAS